MRRKFLWNHGLKAAAVLLIAFMLADMSFGQETEEPTFLSIGKTFTLSGSTQFQYIGWEEGIDSYSVRRSAVSLAGDILEKMHYKLSISFANTPAILDASVEYELSKPIQIRVGQYTVPFSLENVTSNPLVDMINRSQPEEKLVPGRDNSAAGKDIGIAIFGKYSIVEYTLTILNGSGRNKPDTNSHKDLGGRVVVHPLKYLAFGGSFYKGKDSATAEDPLVTRDKAGLEIALVTDRISLKSEYYYAEDGTLTRNGWYAQAGYFILPQKVQALVKYDVVDMNRALSGDQLGRYTAGVNWFISGKTKIQVNYELYKLESGKTDNQALLVMFQVAY